MSTPVLPPADALPPGPPVKVDGGWFAKEASMFSLLAPFISIVVMVFGRSAVGEHLGSMMVITGLAILIVVAGLVLGIAALVAKKEFHKWRIVARAVTGIVLNGAIIALFVLAFQGAYEARKRVLGQGNQQVPRYVDGVTGGAEVRHPATFTPASPLLRVEMDSGSAELQRNGGHLPGLRLQNAST